MVELNPQVPWVADGQGRLIDFGPQWLALTGLTRDQALTVGWSEVPHPDDLPQMLAAWSESLAFGTPLDVQHRIRVADGSYRWMRTRAFPHRDNEGAIIYWYGFTEDVDDRIAMEVALKQSETRYRTIVETAQEGIWTVDAGYRTTFVNSRMAGMLGYTVDEMVGRCVTDFMSPQERILFEQHREQRTVGRAGHYDACYLHKNGTEVWMIVSATGIRDEENRFVGGVALMTDITDRKHLEIAQARLAAIVDSSDDAIISKTLDGIIVSWNRGAQNIFGYSAEEIVGSPKIILFPPERMQEEEDILSRLRRGERIRSFESVRVRKDGVAINVSVTISPIMDRQGNIVGASTIARDITGIKRQQQELAALNAQLRRAMQETHHRVKNNLQVIASILDLSLLDHQDSVPSDEVRRIAHQVMTLASIHDILTRDVSSLEETRALLSVQDILHQLLALIQGNNQRYTIDSDVEPIRLPVRQVTALALATNELVLNAMKHGRQTVSVRLSREGKRALLAVEDDGPGLPVSFDPVTSAHTGLSLVQTLTETDLNGSLQFENRAGGGTRVVLEIPLPDLS